MIFLGLSSWCTYIQKVVEAPVPQEPQVRRPAGVKAAAATATAEGQTPVELLLTSDNCRGRTADSRGCRIGRVGQDESNGAPVRETHLQTGSRQRCLMF